ncbi:murein hydrolase activator EnvC [Gilliamella sp. B2923]|uniref:murein hydrolase activator EnvC n=2 Tax=unclassified Gilliamella TaxID=2685620 RepID=UPI001C6A0F48|nr:MULTISPECIES: murein hydrolase activator EnvC [unclassified Gilliamella]MCX8602022.1 murein hydrolase activator EnvC [Gilliamella sp. B3722]MCX8608359.1 murein hydrolase activator EnvC [Gilliamella sp. B3771]MCX8611292.1 murein hydrolase activator EnvC [Gilliamella sp. B3891]MCX8613864.1 murein hydrolase activator EnvC [Gilliamella sp. B3773]MCX8616346.1 murein hydrolase activator EnvC [Gilliamella sp. B3770]MCX8623636.1 murein hydrolase activator EnvC [Gilliamella sp. B3759]MCX8625862.1 
MSIHNKIVVVTLICLMKVSFLYADDNQQLQIIRQSIEEQETRLAEQKKERTQLVNALKEQETQIAKLLTSIEKNGTILKKLNSEINQLIKQIDDLSAKQTQQRQVLAKQLESAFKLGKSTGFELIFASEENDRNERLITYYRYINQAREQQINALRETQLQLNDKKAALQIKLTTQKALQTKQKQEQVGLVKNQKDRQKTINSLESSMQINEQKLAQLKENETKLQAKIAQAERESRLIAEEEARQAKHIEAKQKNTNYTLSADERSLMARVSGIGQPGHQFDWPVSGTVAHRFGESLQGELHWKGMVINANDGTQVKAIADGRVILASWLQGYGFVVALEHGKGDMSLYGYNQRVLVDVGDKIHANQPIALVGSSGGQNTPSLYFEIRRDGKALDPRGWLK